MADERFDLVVIGGGNMGAALVRGIRRRAGDLRLAVVETSPARRDELASLLADPADPAGGTVVVVDEVPAARSAVIAVKPNHALEAARSAAAAGATRVLSVAAGITGAALAGSVGEGVAVVRSMPNTPALLGEGVIAVCAGPGAGDADLDWAESLLGEAGLVVRVDEHQMDAVTGLTGSGPAYLFSMAEALIDAGVDAGLAPSQVEPMVAQLFVGSARMLADVGDAGRLREQVTSPGGTTAAGLAELDRHGFRSAVAAAVRAATARSVELGEPG